MFDSHAHVAFESFNEDRSEVMRRARAAGLLGWMEVGTDLAQSKKALALAHQEEGVFASIGVHPSDIGELNEEVWTQLTQLLNDPKVKAVGEVGLDFYRGGTLIEQLPVLKRFISLAQAKTLPVIFHVRNSQEQNAHDALLELLISYSDTDRPRGVIHTYSGTVEQAKRYLELGMYLSFSGVVTFKNAGEIAAVARMTPMDKILVETDCPFLAPVPHRGQRNEPAYVGFVAEKIAELRGISSKELEKKTDQNAVLLFDL